MNRKKRRKHLQHDVPNVRRVVYKHGDIIITHLRLTSNPHSGKGSDRAFPEQQDYKPKYMRSIIRHVQFLGGLSRNTNIELHKQLRTAFQIKASGVNYTSIVKKQKVEV